MFHICSHLRYPLPAEGPGLSKALAAVASKCICVSSALFRCLPWCIIVLHWESDFFKVPIRCVTEIFSPLTMSNDQLLCSWRNRSVLQLIPLYWEQIASSWIPLVFALAEINSGALGCWQVHRNTWVLAASLGVFLLLPSEAYPELDTFVGLGEKVHSFEQQLNPQKRMSQNCKKFLIAGIIGLWISEFCFSAWG